jgi:hypothetical protein
MKFLTNAMVFARKTPLRTWIVAIIVPGGLVGITAWISVKSAYRILKKRHDKVTSDR